MCMVNTSHATQEIFQTYLPSLNETVLSDHHLGYIFFLYQGCDRKDRLNEIGDGRRMSQGSKEPNTKFKSLLHSGSRRIGRIWFRKLICVSMGELLAQEALFSRNTQWVIIWYRLPGLKSLCLFQCLCLPDSLNLLSHWHHYHPPMECQHSPSSQDISWMHSLMGGSHLFVSELGCIVEVVSWGLLKFCPWRCWTCSSSSFFSVGLRLAGDTSRKV